MSTPIVDRHVELNTLVVAVAWIVGTLLVILHLVGLLAVGYCGLGLVVVCYGAVREVTGRIYRLERIQRNAYELGRESALRSIR